MPAMHSVAMVIRWTGFLKGDRSDHFTRRLVVYTRDTGRMSSRSASGLACTPLQIGIQLIIDHFRNSFALTLWNVPALLSGNLKIYEYIDTLYSLVVTINFLVLE